MLLDHAQAIDVAGQPTSITFRLTPKFLTIACAAGPKFLTNKSMTKKIPTKATPIKRDLNAAPIFCLKNRPSKNMTTGKITVAPKSEKSPYKISEVTEYLNPPCYICIVTILSDCDYI